MALFAATEEEWQAHFSPPPYCAGCTKGMFALSITDPNGSLRGKGPLHALIYLAGPDVSLSAPACFQLDPETCALVPGSIRSGCPKGKGTVVKLFCGKRDARMFPAPRIGAKVREGGVCFLCVRIYQRKAEGALQIVQMGVLGTRQKPAPQELYNTHEMAEETAAAKHYAVCE